MHMTEFEPLRLDISCLNAPWELTITNIITQIHLLSALKLNLPSIQSKETAKILSLNDLRCAEKHAPALKVPTQDQQ